MSSGGYEKSDADIKRLFLVSIIPVVAILLSILLVNYYFAYTQIQEEEIQNAEVDSRLIEMRLNDLEKLGSYALVDATQDRYRIPVERAKQLMVNEIQRAAGVLRK